jgi:hypothetical protein
MAQLVLNGGSTADLEALWHYNPPYEIPEAPSDTLKDIIGTQS